jgi:hypothetical protein
MELTNIEIEKGSMNSMRTSRRFSSLLLILAALILFAAAAMAADPGLSYPADSQISDQKAGSVLIYNIYTSSPTNPAVENSQINVTNTSSARAAFIHLFFIDGSSCSPADSIMCLTPNQTASFRASDFDPGTMGYLVAIAVDANGWPANHNFLIGDVYVKFAAGHAASLGAEAIAVRELPTYDATASTATLSFNGVQYNRLPMVVAASSIPSRVDGNDTMLILNRVSGNLAIGADAIGALFGILYNDAENAYSFQLNTSQCQLKFSLSNNQPRTTPRFTNVIPTGRTGWAKIWSTASAPLLGATINFNQSAAGSANAFSQGHNFHKLTFTTSNISIPVFPPNC